jgi:hypothetical protein
MDSRNYSIPSLGCMVIQFVVIATLVTLALVFGAKGEVGEALGYGVILAVLIIVGEILTGKEGRK